MSVAPTLNSLNEYINEHDSTVPHSEVHNIVTPSLKLRNRPVHTALPVLPTLNNLKECNNK